LLTCLMVCLNSDQHCYSIWRQMYTKHLPQSAVLLDHIGMYAHRGVLKIFGTVFSKTSIGVLRTIHFLPHIMQFKYWPTNVIISGMFKQIYSNICDIQYWIIRKALLISKLAKSGQILSCGTISCFFAFASYRVLQCSAWNISFLSWKGLVKSGKE
jgi:hypothetical protein